MARNAADIYLIYARQDRAEAENLARELDDRGFTVFWDQQILTGDDMQRELASRLRAARLAVVLPSEDASRSRYVQMEAAEARRLGKLLVLDRPAGFGPTDAAAQAEQVIEHLMLERSLDEVVEASVAQTPPQPPQANPTSRAPAPPPLKPMTFERRRVEPSVPRPLFEAPGRARAAAAPSLRELRAQMFYWFGVGGAIVTLVGNLETFLTLAQWVKFVFGNWAEIITFLWNFLIPFDFEVLPEDAVILTLITILFFNLVVTSAHRDFDARARIWDYALLAACSVAVSYLAFLGFVSEADPARAGLVDSLMAPVLAALHRVAPANIDAVASFFTMGLAGAALMGVAYLPLAAGLQIRPHVNAFAVRLLRILAGVALVAIINQLSLAIEAQDWGAALRTAEAIGAARPPG